MVHDDGPTCVMTDYSRSMRRGSGRRGVRVVRKGREALWRLAAAELAGTALLLLLTCLPARASPAPPDPHTAPAPRPSLLHAALASGLTVALIVQCFDHISGAQLNPTVTLARALGGHESAGRALALAAAQLAGALLGAAAAAALGAAPAACLTRPADGVAPYQAAVVEAALGGCLALANLAAWDERTRRLRDSWPLRIGLSVAALTFAAGEVSGASMNPVRSFAPALLAARWEHQWVYWVGPLSGSCVCTALYRCVWRVPPARDSPCVQCARCAQCVQCARCVQCVRCAQCAHSAPPARTAEPDCTRLSDKAPAPIRLTTD